MDPTAGGGPAPSRSLSEPMYDAAPLVYPAGADEAARAAFSGAAIVTAPQEAMRQCGPAFDHARGDVLDTRIETEFIGAVLCGCLTIEKYILKGTYGRGWLGENEPVAAGGGKRGRTGDGGDAPGLNPISHRVPGAALPFSPGAPLGAEGVRKGGCGRTAPRSLCSSRRSARTTTTLSTTSVCAAGTGAQS